MKSRTLVFLGVAALFLIICVQPAAADKLMTLESFALQLQSMDGAARHQYIYEVLTEAQRKSLHQQFRALTPDQRKAHAALLQDGAEPTAKRAKTRAIGTMSYDTGVAHPFKVPAPGGGANDIGNFFNTGFSSPHSISQITVQMAGTWSGYGHPARVYDAPSTAGAAVMLATIAMGTAPGLGTPNAYALPTAIVGHTGAFLVAAWQTGSTTTTFNTTYRGVALDTNDAGAGFHGMTIIWPNTTGATAGTGFNASPTVGAGLPFNAIVRASGDNLPVELMTFTAE
ncbi:MAG: hypothetical protein DRJ65_18750 [Acidobacteria bacterium]|nr:MAG: hypothetical protein DRJ65_18750 [Acidobacteriota bacterium]